MKILIYITLLFSHYMNLNDFNNLLGKDFSTVNFILSNEFQNELFGEKFFYSKTEVPMKLYGFPYNAITVKTNDRNLASSFTFHINDIVNEEFYDLIVMDYGKPKNIQIIDKEEIISRSTGENNELKQQITKGSFTTRSGSINENPIFISWEKEGLKISIFIRRESNISELTISR